MSASLARTFDRISAPDRSIDSNCLPSVGVPAPDQDSGGGEILTGFCFKLPPSLIPADLPRPSFNIEASEATEWARSKKNWLANSYIDIHVLALCVLAMNGSDNHDQ